IRQREYAHFKKLDEYRKENEKITKAFLSVIDDEHKPNEIFYLYKDLPRLPFGCVLKKFICAWLNIRSKGDDFSELGFERWLLEGRSEEICKRISEDWPDLAGPFNTMLARLLNKIRQPDDRPPFNIRSPRYREYNANKSVIEKELAWLCNPCRNTEKEEMKMEEKDKNSERLQLRRALPDKGLNERGLLSTIKDHGWKEKGSHDAIFDIIDRGDAAVMEALIKLEGSKILYSTLEYVKTNGNGIPEAYLSLPPLHAAIITGNLQITAELIKNGTDVNKKIEEDPDRNIGSTPLHLACDYFSPKIIFLLLDSGALCNTARDEGRTPLHLAALKDKNGTVIRRMINAGADVNAKDKYG
ncbi:MAG: ankyrin repeat domain-containing protein, partial [Bacteroidia bacterium]|nr:ankyrin repeat domain-containing protein [Bacteroidia bacterium]